MVYVQEESVFEASIERIWKFLMEGGDRPKHETILSETVLEEEGNNMTLRVETMGPKGVKEDQIWQLSMNPPFGWQLEVLEGSTKGSKSSVVYVPMGEKTKVIVVGDFHVQGLDDAETVQATRDFFARMFDEENVNLQAFS